MTEGKNRYEIARFLERIANTPHDYGFAWVGGGPQVSPHEFLRLVAEKLRKGEISINEEPTRDDVIESAQRLCRLINQDTGSGSIHDHTKSCESAYMELLKKARRASELLSLKESKDREKKWKPSEDGGKWRRWSMRSEFTPEPKDGYRHWRISLTCGHVIEDYRIPAWDSVPDSFFCIQCSAE